MKWRNWSDKNDRDDLGWTRCIGEGDCDGVVVRANIERVLVRKGHINGRAGDAPLAGGRDPRLGATQRVSDRIGKGRRQNCIAVLILAVDTNDAGLSVTFNFTARRHIDKPPSKFSTQLGRGIDQPAELFAEPAGIWIGENRRDRIFPKALAIGGDAALVAERFFAEVEPLANIVAVNIFRHGNPFRLDAAGRQLI